MAAISSGVRRSRAEWRSLIERAQRSPLSVRAFCASQGVSTASFYLWRKRLGMEARATQPQSPAVQRSGFLDLGELAVQAGGPVQRADGWELELDLGAGVIVRLRRR